MKDNRVGLSFGYLTVKSRKRGEVTDLLELDLFEISIVPSPANPQTRILEMKSGAITERELRRRCDKLALEAALGWQPVPLPAPEPAAKSVPTDSQLRQRAARLGVELSPTYLETVRAEAKGPHAGLPPIRAADRRTGKQPVTGGSGRCTEAQGGEPAGYR